MHMRLGMAIAAALLTQGPPRVRVQTREVEYRQGDTVLKGFIAWNDSAAGKRPGVLVVHEWWGPNEPARNPARAPAGTGNVGLGPAQYRHRKRDTQPQKPHASPGARPSEPPSPGGRA